MLTVRNATRSEEDAALNSFMKFNNGLDAPSPKNSVLTLHKQVLDLRQSNYERILDIAALAEHFAKESARQKESYEKLRSLFDEVHAKRKAFYAKSKELEKENALLRDQLRSLKSPLKYIKYILT